MANNLVISYDLYNPGQDYAKVIDTIKTLGSWAKIHKSVWYVNSNHSAAQAVAKVWPVMDKNDSLFVVDATNNSASWQNLNDTVANNIKNEWLK